MPTQRTPLDFRSGKSTERLPPKLNDSSALQPNVQVFIRPIDQMWNQDRQILAEEIEIQPQTSARNGQANSRSKSKKREQPRAALRRPKTKMERESKTTRAKEPSTRPIEGPNAQPDNTLSDPDFRRMLMALLQ